MCIVVNAYFQYSGKKILKIFTLILIGSIHFKFIFLKGFCVFDAFLKACGLALLNKWENGYFFLIFQDFVWHFLLPCLPEFTVP